MSIDATPPAEGQEVISEAQAARLLGMSQPALRIRRLRGDINPLPDESSLDRPRIFYTRAEIDRFREAVRARRPPISPLHIPALAS